MTDADKDVPSLSTPGPAEEQSTEPTVQRHTARRIISVLLALCLLGFFGLVVVAALDALIDSPLLVRATPMPAFANGEAVRLMAPEHGPVTVWQVSGDCEPGMAFGEVPSGSEARIDEGFCYNRKPKRAYQRIALSTGSGGWVEVGNLVSAAAYIPPTPTETVEPTPAPAEPPTPTVPPTETPIPAPLPPGSTLSAGNWDVRVERLELTDAVYSGAGDASVQASGRFALIYLNVTNTGVHAAALHASRVVIQDAAGTEYRNNDLASAYASSPDCADFVLDLAPGTSACLVAAVDLPLRSDTYALTLSGAGEWVLLELP